MRLLYERNKRGRESLPTVEITYTTTHSSHKQQATIVDMRDLTRLDSKNKRANANIILHLLMSIMHIYGTHRMWYTYDNNHFIMTNRIENRTVQCGVEYDVNLV